jgi:catechol 2,3-dioxygenase-like lactoylglutathione lyase family enzyme
LELRIQLCTEEGAQMSLSNYEVNPAIAVSDMETAKEFYEGKLGLSGGRDTGDGGVSYPCAGGTELHIFPSPNAGKSDATMAGWGVDDIETVVDELISNGVTFEQYGEPFNTNEKGIATVDGTTIAFFRDPDGNTFALIQQ